MLLRPKSWMMVVLGAVVASSVGAGTVFSYMRTTHSQIGETIRDAVPITFELKRLKQMVSDLVPEIQANQKVAATLDVEVEYLQREIEQMRKDQDEAAGQMQKLRDSLKSRRKTYEFGGQSFTRQKIEDDLGHRLTRYGNTRIQLEAKERILESRKQTLAAATEKIRQYQHQHQMLMENAESLQSELKLAEMSQQSGGFSFDNSRLDQAKELSREVEKRIRTLQKLVDGQQQVRGEIPVEADSRPIEEVYDDFFAEK